MGYDSFHWKFYNPEILQIRENSNSSVQIHWHIEPKTQPEDVPRDTKECRFGGFRGCSISSGNFQLVSCVVQAHKHTALAHIAD